MVPPKPNEFDMAYSSSALRAKLGTRSIPAVSGSGIFQVDGRRENLVAQRQHSNAGLEALLRRHKQMLRSSTSWS